jgi:glycosyltransferase involved in cell wall biosynthesis
MNDRKNTGAPPVRVALIADDFATAPGHAQTLKQLRERGLPGHEIDVIGTHATADRRLAAVAETELPLYPGLGLHMPSPSALTQALTDRPYDLVHVCAAGPAGIAAALIARDIALPIAGSYHTELPAYAPAGSGDPRFEGIVGATLSGLYRHCRVVLSPSRAADASLAMLGVPADDILRWERGVDLDRFNPARYSPDALPSGFNLLYVGALGTEDGVDLLAEAFLIAHDRDPRLRLNLVGRGPHEAALRARLGSAANFLGWVEDDDLASVYASADLLIFPATIGAPGHAILEAQACGLPVLAADGGGAAELIENGRSGCLVEPDPAQLGAAIRGLARREAILDRLATGGLLAARERSWPRSLEQLASGWARALATATELAPPAEVARAA